MMVSIGKIWYGFMAVVVIAMGALPAYALTPNDPGYVNQWYLKHIGAEKAWDALTPAMSTAQGKQPVVVAVIDTGVDMTAPDLKDAIWVNRKEVPGDGVDNDANIYVDDIRGWDFVDGDNDPSPDIADPLATREGVNHGTLVAGIIAAHGNNAQDIAGIAWGVKIMPLRVLDSQGRGDTSLVEEAINYAVANGADIINLSFVGEGFSRSMFLALKRAFEKGVLVVAAVGNSGTAGLDLGTNPLYPVCYTGVRGEDVVLGVGATDTKDTKAGFSNYGGNCVDIMAPGVSIYTTNALAPSLGFLDRVSGGWSGTSMASPMVSGAAAYLKLLDRSLDASTLRDLLTTSADPLDALNVSYAGKIGAGRLNLARAVELLQKGTFFPVARGATYTVVSTPQGTTPEITVLSRTGRVVSSFLAYGKAFRGGVNIATGDIDGDGRDEIITGAGPGGGPHVRVFTPGGEPLFGFFAFDGKTRGGVRVAVARTTDASYIVTAPVGGYEPRITITTPSGHVVASFLAYGKAFRGGVNIATGDIDGDGRDEIITGAGPGGGPHVRVFTLEGKELLGFFPYPNSMRLGVRVAVVPAAPGQDVAIVTTLQRDAPPEIRLYDGRGAWIRAFMAYGDKQKGGVSLDVGDADADGVDEIVAGSSAGALGQVTSFDVFGRKVLQFTPLGANYKAGVQVSVLHY